MRRYIFTHKKLHFVHAFHSTVFINVTVSHNTDPLRIFFYTLVRKYSLFTKYAFIFYWSLVNIVEPQKVRLQLPRPNQSSFYDFKDKSLIKLSSSVTKRGYYFQLTPGISNLIYNWASFLVNYLCAISNRYLCLSFTHQNLHLSHSWQSSVRHRTLPKVEHRDICRTHLVMNL